MRGTPAAASGFRTLTTASFLVLLASGCTTDSAPEATAVAAQPSPYADCAALSSPPAGTPASAAPAAADLPDVTLPCFTGEQPFRLTDLRGPAVVNLWGTWCAPCREELPAVQRLADRTQGRLHVVGVDTRDSREAAGSFGTDLRITIPNLYDREERLRIAAGVSLLPATIFVDAAGRQYTYRGLPLDDAALDRLVVEHTGVRP